jgi:hypothetical protein
MTVKLPIVPGFFSTVAGSISVVPGPIARCGPSRPDLGKRWPSRLVATAEEDRLSFRRNPNTSLGAASTMPLQRSLSSAVCVG